MIRIATAQSYIDSDVHKNGQEVRRLMARAYRSQAQLIHFPEAAMSGYIKSQIKNWNTVDWDILRAELEQTAILAKELNLWVVIGSNHNLTSPNLPHNSLYIISNKGELHSRYDKQYLSNSELNGYYTPGQKNIVFEIDDWKFGLSICIEIQFPEMFASYREQEVDCMLLSAYSDSEVFKIQARAHAATNNYWLSYSTPSQCSSKTSSAIIGPDGSIIKTCKNNESSIVVADLDKKLDKWEVPLEYAKPWRKRARKGGIYQSKNIVDKRSKERSKF